MRPLVAVVVLHGLLHSLGAAEGLGWADVSVLTRPISAGMGIAWLATAVLVVATGLLLARSVAWWWMVGVTTLVYKPEKPALKHALSLPLSAPVPKLPCAV